MVLTIVGHMGGLRCGVRTTKPLCGVCTCTLTLLNVGHRGCPAEHETALATTWQPVATCLSIGRCLSAQHIVKEKLKKNGNEQTVTHSQL